MRHALALTLAFTLTACGGGGSGDGTDEGGTTGGGSLCDGTAKVTGCQMAWTGDDAGQEECHPSYEPGTPTSLDMASWTAPTAYLNLIFASPPTVGTYALADAALINLRGGVLGGDTSYLLFKTSPPYPSSGGELSLTITSLDESGNPHGHFRGVAGLTTNGFRKIELCGQF